jgi:hypothetical protein
VQNKRVNDDIIFESRSSSADPPYVPPNAELVASCRTVGKSLQSQFHAAQDTAAQLDEMLLALAEAGSTATEIGLEVGLGVAHVEAVLEGQPSTLFICREAVNHLEMSRDQTPK